MSAMRACSHLSFGSSTCRPHRALELAHGMQLTHFVGMVLKLASHAVSLCTAGCPVGLPAMDTLCLLLVRCEPIRVGSAGGDV